MAANANPRGRQVPKFGEWDNKKNAEAAQGFTVIFNNARDQKKTKGTAVGGPQMPPPAPPPPARGSNKNADNRKKNNRQHRHQQHYQPVGVQNHDVRQKQDDNQQQNPSKRWMSCFSGGT